MSKSNISKEFKRDAVRQIIERGYPVAEVSQRLEVNKHSFYEWEKKFAAANDKGNDEAKDLRQHALPAHQSAKVLFAVPEHDYTFSHSLAAAGPPG